MDYQEVPRFRVWHVYAPGNYAASVDKTSDILTLIYIQAVLEVEGFFEQVEVKTQPCDTLTNYSKP